MKCTKPLRGYVIGVDPKSGKNIIKITKSVLRPDQLGIPEGSKELLLPCGSCMSCRLNYAHDWADRMMCELQSYEEGECHFVTLTYSPAALAGATYVVDGKYLRCNSVPAANATGEALDQYSLSKRDLQLFMKRLRRRFPDQKIRFFACGEYGEGERHHPHYHLILFGLRLPDDDLKPYKRSKLGYWYYNSSVLSMVWPFGFVVVGDVTPSTCSYTARYMLKKQKGENAHVYSDVDIEAPFTLSSRKPGLGFEYYSEHLGDIIRNRPIVLSTRRGSYSFQAPQYFKRQLEEDYPLESKDLRENAQDVAQSSFQLELEQTDLEDFEYFEVLNHKVDESTKSLIYYRQL